MARIYAAYESERATASIEVPGSYLVLFAQVAISFCVDTSDFDGEQVFVHDDVIEHAAASAAGRFASVAVVVANVALH
jgi:hypothetical protein